MTDESIADPSDTFDRALTLPTWCAQINWAVTTENECYGHPPADDPWQNSYAIYDADKDDPPIAVCALRDDAERIVEALKLVGKWEPDND